jgi:PAS domain S-box-containing protein
LPIYAKGRPPATVEERRRSLLGLAYAPIVIDELLSKLPDVEAGLLGLQIFDSALGKPEGVPLFSAGERSAISGPNRHHFMTLQALSLPGRTLTLSVSSTSQFEASFGRSTPALLRVSGALISVMLALLLYQQTNGRRRAEQLAQDMTVDLTRLAQVVKHTANAVLIGDREGRITWINEGFSRMTGYSAAEAIGKTAGELVGSGKADAKTLEILAETVANGTSCRVEILNRAKGGREYWTEIELQPQRDAKGAVIGFMEVGTDITQRRQVEAEAIRHWELLRGSIDALDEAFVLYDPQGRLVLCNEKYKQVYQNVAHLMVPGARFLDIIRAGAEMGQYATAVGRIDAWVTERLAAHLSGNSDLIQRHTNGRT